MSGVDWIKNIFDDLLMRFIVGSQNEFSKYFQR